VAGKQRIRQVHCDNSTVLTLVDRLYGWEYAFGPQAKDKNVRHDASVLKDALSPKAIGGKVE
jgi:hypothetical protein